MTTRQRRASKIMLLRHAEKPAKDGAPFGITREGERSKESLEVRGWQRAGALTNVFAPMSEHFQHRALDTPQFLYASKPLRRKGSRRPLETIMPLGEKLGIKINTEFQRSQLVSMVEDVVSRRGVVLICWQREYIPDIAALILGAKNVAPSEWPEDRFDMIWVFDLHHSSSSYKFQQVPQELLAGDSIKPIR